MEIPGWPPENIGEMSKRLQTIFYEKVDEFELSVRAAICLKNEGIVYAER